MPLAKLCRSTPWNLMIQAWEQSTDILSASVLWATHSEFSTSLYSKTAWTHSTKQQKDLDVAFSEASSTRSREKSCAHRHENVFRANSFSLARPSKSGTAQHIRARARFSTNPMLQQNKQKMCATVPSRAPVEISLQSIFVNSYRRFEIQNVINLNMCHAPGD